MSVMHGCALHCSFICMCVYSECNVYMYTHVCCRLYLYLGLGVRVRVFSFVCAHLCRTYVHVCEGGKMEKSGMM